jgi:hypothetical protein
MGRGCTVRGASGVAGARFAEQTVARGTRVAAATFSLLKGARRGEKDGGSGPTGSTQREEGAAKVGSQQQPASSGHGRHQLVRDRGIEGALTGGVRATMPGDSNRFK